MTLIHSGYSFSNRSLPYPARSTVPHLPEKKPIPTGRDTLVKKRIFRPVAPNNRTAVDWTAIGWPTTSQFKIPDGEFGPVQQMAGWKDCWFLSALAAVANNPDGHQILAKSIKKGEDGYEVTFKAVPHNTLFISWDELQKCLTENGGDADTRLFELAADKFFNQSGNFKSVFIATLMRGGLNQDQAEQCFHDLCRQRGIQDAMVYNPMRSSGIDDLAFFMFTGMYPDVVDAANSSNLLKDDVMQFLKQYVPYDSGGGSVVITGSENPLGNSGDSRELVTAWDGIRTEITRGKELSEQALAFLNALDKWLDTRISYALQDLKSAVGNLKLKYIDLVKFVEILERNLFHMNHEHFNLLRSGVREVLAGGPGYIGFPGGHSGTMEGINKEANTFTYSEPNTPGLVHTGALSDLIQAVISGDVLLDGLNPTAETDDGDRERFEHAGTSRGRRLRQLHNEVIHDGKIDQAESGPLADLLEMEDDTFRQVYDSDKNDVIEGDELKAVQLRVDRWVDHLELTPIW